MLDLHCHILAGIDDGAPDLDSAVKMAKTLVQTGFHTVAASPHTGAGPGGDVSAALASECRATLTGRLVAENVPLRLLPNAEHHVSPELFGRLGTADIVSIGGLGA